MGFKQSFVQVLHGAWGILKTSTALIIHCIKTFTRELWLWVKSVVGGVKALWFSLGPRWLRWVFVSTGLIFLSYAGAKWALKPNLTLENIEQVRYLNEGWNDELRELFYYTPQGTELLGMHYDWLVNLELPLSKEQLASSDNMRGWGFVVNPGQFSSAKNRGNLPVGMTLHQDTQSNNDKLDLGCAVCHTGELHYQGIALRVDGGQAIQSISTVKRGEFITTLGLAVLETYLNPFKWNRFADRMVGNDDVKRDKLRDDMWVFIGSIKDFGVGPGALSYYPTEEGRGRTDAVGRIANVLFGYNIDVPENYRIADAPVSYPFLWDIWRFDWVQYTGFTNQAMSRNIGESLGVLAPIRLVDDEGNFLRADQIDEAVINMEGMHCVETILRKLKPPKWPEDVLGKIDMEKAKRGKAIFADQCAFCHGPHISEPYAWPVADGPDKNPDNQIDVNWQWDMDGEITRRDNIPYRDDWRDTIWALPRIDVGVIGTDATAANNFIDTKYDATKIIPESAPVNASDGLQIVLNRLVPLKYKRRDIVGDKIPDYDGLNVPFRISNKRAYKARPLHGVWATPPFLHNGSVPTIYDLLSPLRVRPKTFAVGNREFDPVKLGYTTEQLPGSFIHDTSVKGNSNQGHLFTDLDTPGRIGKLLEETERMELIEYIKIMGNPDFTKRLEGDPMDWSQYSEPPEDKSGKNACLVNPHSLS